MTTLMQEFNKVAHNITPSPGFKGLKHQVGVLFSLNTTLIMQRLGYNKRKIRSLKKDEIILNIGCLNYDKNCINSDLFPTLGTFLKILTKKKQFNCDLFLNVSVYDESLSNFANGIVLSHVLEHIIPTKALVSLRNCFNYLKPGGSIRVCVPCLDNYIHGDIPPYSNLSNRTLAMNRVIYGSQHRFMYDAKILRVLLEEAGFTEVKEVAFREGLLNETDIEFRASESIYLTAIKPQSMI